MSDHVSTLPKSSIYDRAARPLFSSGIPILYAHLFLQECGDPAGVLVGPSILKANDILVELASYLLIQFSFIYVQKKGLRWMGYFGGWSQKPQLGLGNW